MPFLKHGCESLVKKPFPIVSIVGSSRIGQSKYLQSEGLGVHYFETPSN